MTNIMGPVPFLQEVFGADFATRAILGLQFSLKGFSAHRDIADLSADNGSYFGCYFSIAAFPDDGSTVRRNDRADEVRTLVVDDVGTKIMKERVLKVMPQPTAIVETSPGNFQWSWRLAVPVSVKDWAGFIGDVSEALGHRLDGKDAVHWFRLPMGVNLKDEPGKKGFEVKLVELNSGVTLDTGMFGAQGSAGAQVQDPFAQLAQPVQNPAQNLAQNFGDMFAPAAPAATPPAGGPARKIRDIAGLVGLLPNDAGVDRASWVARGHQVKALAVDDAAGFAAFDAWSQRWDGGGYDAAETSRVWKSLPDARDLMTAGQTLLRDAAAADPGGFAGIMNREAASVFDDNERPPPAGGGSGGSGGGGGGRYWPTHRNMAEAIVGAETGRLGWQTSAPKRWMAFDDVMRKWVLSQGETPMRTAVRFEIEARLRTGVDPKVARELHKSHWHGAVCSLLRQEGRLELDEARFDIDPDVLGVPGGVMRLKAGAGGGFMLRAAEAADRVTKATSVTPDFGMARPRWAKFLKEITGGDQPLEDWLQVMAGYCASGHTREQIIVYLYGGGGNGKSVFIETLADVLGDYRIAGVPELFLRKQGGFHLAPLAALRGARLVTVADIPVGATWDMGLLKRVSGGEAITANRMHENPITFVPAFKLLMAGNDKPRMERVDAGVRRRFRLVPFRFKPPVADTGLRGKLMQEAEGILAWVLEGWERWAAFGFPACPAVEDETEAYLNGADTFGRWLASGLVKKKGSGWVRLSEVWRAWDTFRAAEQDMTAEPAHIQSFATRLRDEGFEIVIRNTLRHVRDAVLTGSPASGVF